MSQFTWSLLQQRMQGVTGTYLAIAIGLALTVSAAAVRLNYTLPVQARAAELRQDLVAREKPVVARRMDRLPRDLPTDASWSHRFYRHFPKKENIPNLLRVIYRTAEGQGLLLAEGSYQLALLKDTRLAAYQISLPVTGSYAQVRQFVAQLLHALPTVAVDELHFSRDAITTAQLEAKIRLTLYLRVNDVTD